MHRRSVAAILVAGLLVAVAPFVWYGVAFTDPFAPNPASTGAKIVAAAFALPGFVALAGLRSANKISLVGCVIAFVGSAAVVVLLQYATLDPNDTSSTAILGFIFESIWGVGAVLVATWLDWIGRLAARRTPTP